MTEKIFYCIIAIIMLLSCFKKGRWFLYYIISSFDNFSKGASANKLSAAAAVTIGIVVTRLYTNQDNILYILICWQIFALLCLGIIVTRQLIELVQSYKGGNSGKTQLEEKEPLHEVLEESKK